MVALPQTEEDKKKGVGADHGIVKLKGWTCQGDSGGPLIDAKNTKALMGIIRGGPNNEDKKLPLEKLDQTKFDLNFKGKVVQYERKGGPIRVQKGVSYAVKLNEMRIEQINEMMHDDAANYFMQLPVHAASRTQYGDVANGMSILCFCVSAFPLRLLCAQTTLCTRRRWKILRWREIRIGRQSGSTMPRSHSLRGGLVG